ncbi:MAG: hypothetical protein JNM85_05665 [Chthonomonas sp.]|nr:hypothetical protein [Chthonomonas sp.]
MDTAISPVNGNDFFGTGAPKKAKSDLDMAAFLRLLTTQLSNQNPLEPMNDRDFFAQMAQLGTVQGIDQLKASAEVEQANAMIGKEVVAVRTGQELQGQEAFVKGIVKGVTMVNGERMIQVQEANGGIAEVKIGNIKSIGEPAVNSRVDTAVALANSAQFIGKTVTANHPTLRDSSNNPEKITGAVKKVSFEKGSVYFTIQDRLGKDVQVSLLDVQSFSD